MDIAVIGAGRIGKLHLEILQRHQQIRQIYVYDPYLDMDWLNNQSISACHSINQLLGYSLDGIVIASPSDQHLEHVEMAAKANLPILCEKPLGLEPNQIQQTLSLVDESNVILQVGFNRRFDPHFASLKQSIVNSNETPHVIKITSRDPACPNASYLQHSGGLFMDMAIHDFDMACFLAAAKPTSIHAMGSCTVNSELNNYDDIDTAICMIRFSNGTMAMIDNCRQAVYGYDQRAEVYSNTQLWKVENPHQHALQTWSVSGQHKAPLQHFFLERYQQAYINQMNSFLDSIQNNKEASVNGLDGLMAVKLAQAAKQSLSLGKPITIE